MLSKVTREVEDDSKIDNQFKDLLQLKCRLGEVQCLPDLSFRRVSYNY